MMSVWAWLVAGRWWASAATTAAASTALITAHPASTRVRPVTVGQRGGDGDSATAGGAGGSGGWTGFDVVMAGLRVGAEAYRTGLRPWAFGQTSAGATRAAGTGSAQDTRG